MTAVQKSAEFVVVSTEADVVEVTNYAHREGKHVIRSTRVRAVYGESELTFLADGAIPKIGDLILVTLGGVRTP